MSMSSNAYKAAAAEEAISNVNDGMIVGLGSGRTAALAIKALGARVRAGLNVVAIPTSVSAARLARFQCIPIIEFSPSNKIDVSIQEADEVCLESPAIINGHSGVILNEKVVAFASERLFIVADESKFVDRLCKNIPLPVEISPFGWEVTAEHIKRLNGDPILRITHDEEPFRTSGGNFIVDCYFQPIENPFELILEVSKTAGVIESGLWVDIAHAVLFIGRKSGVERLPFPVGRKRSGTNTSEDTKSSPIIHEILTEPSDNAAKQGSVFAKEIDEELGRDAENRLNELKDAVEKSNILAASRKDQLVVMSQIDSFLSMLKMRYIDECLVRFWTSESGLLWWLQREISSGVIRKLAGNVTEALLRILS
jgi:ribose 5-phosphate isomerase A